MKKTNRPGSHRRDGKRVHAEAIYEVGYGKAPVGHRFEKGRSGNPKGRPKVNASLQEIARAAFEKRTRVIIDGKAVGMTMWDLAVHQQVMKAAKGDVAAFRNIIAFTRLFPQMAEARQVLKTVTADMSPQEAMEAYLAYARAGK